MENIDIKYIDNERIYSEFKKLSGKTPNITNTTSLTDKDGVKIIEFNSFKNIDFVRQGFSTRIGGVSSGIYESMNLTFGLSDKYENVAQNFNIIARTLGISPDRMVYSKQTHTNNVMAADNSHAGMGVVRKRDFDNIDALVTNEKNLCLVTSYADCIPVIAADTVNRCIGAAHAGWRGTVSDIAGNMIELMAEKYSGNPDNISVFVGPGICADCYEVSDDVAVKFKEQFGDDVFRLIAKIGKEPGKYQLNLPMANVFNLLKHGVKPENISVSDICTCCNSKWLFSHRASAGKRGLLCNFIYITDEAK